VIHVQVPSWHPQQHICHPRKSEPSLYDSLTNILHFIKRTHPHQTTGSKVPEFRGKNSPFCPPCIYDGFFCQSELDYQTKSILHLKETLFKDLFLEFKIENPEIRDFYENLNQQSKQVLHVSTPESEETFVSMRILSMLSFAPKDSFIMLRSSFPSDVIEQGSNVFKSEQSCHLLVLQIDPNSSLSEEQFGNFLEPIQDGLKRMILISDSN
jgi:hypothetical protein